MEFQPVIPFEPVSTAQIPSGKQWVAQVKWDGVRVLTYYDGKEVRLFNRRLNERTMQYPELTGIKSYCRAASVILDGEIIALEQGKPSFEKVMRRDAVRRPEKVQRACKEVPVVYMVFDILFYNGEWITGRTLEERQKRLHEIITPCEDVQPVENFGAAESLFEVVRVNEMEGIVCKDLNSGYAVRGKDNRWQKLKNYKDLTAVIGGVTFRGSIVNSVLLGAYDTDGRLWYIGHAGTGKLTQDQWRSFTERVIPLAEPNRSFVNKPERIKDAVWLKPAITAKIRFAGWTGANTLRQPSIQAFVDIPPDACVLETEPLKDRG